MYNYNYSQVFTEFVAYGRASTPKDSARKSVVRCVYCSTPRKELTDECPSCGAHDAK